MRRRRALDRRFPSAAAADSVPGSAKSRRRKCETSNPPPTSPSTPASVHAQSSRLRASRPDGAGFVVSCPIHRSSCHRSRALCQRASGSFARQVLTRRSSAGGVCGWLAVIGAGSACMIAPIRLASRLPPKGPLPRQHFVYDRPEREDVRTCVRLLPVELLRRHVLQCAEDRATRREARRRRPSKRAAISDSSKPRAWRGRSRAAWHRPSSG